MLLFFIIQLTVTRVSPSSNAYKAGLRAGHRIVTLCNTRVDRCTVQDIDKIFNTKYVINMEVELTATAPDASSVTSEVSDITHIIFIY